MDSLTLILLCIAAFGAGFVDAIVGGGGLLQTPAGLLLLPQFPVADVIGTLKIPAFSGTLLAARQYLRRVRMNWIFLLTMMAMAVMAAYSGSALLTRVPNGFMKPLLLVILSLIAVYTFLKKNFGQHVEKEHSTAQKYVYGLSIAAVVGFYDGFVGPGAGSFFVLAFVTILGFDFLRASAHAKMVNLATNMGSICLFLLKGKIIWVIAVPMAVSNALGGWLGAKLAISKGNQFIRIFFFIVVVATLVRFAFDVFR